MDEARLKRIHLSRLDKVLLHDTNVINFYLMSGSAHTVRIYAMDMSCTRLHTYLACSCTSGDLLLQSGRGTAEDEPAPLAGLENN